MTMPALVSVLTPTHDHARFIDECIASVLRQSYTRWEQIVIDDASTDGTAMRVQRHGDPRIRLIEQEHRGVWRLAETYNSALSRADGELIAILEGDDLWPSDKLASLVPLFEDPSVVLAYGVTELVSADGGSLGTFIPSHRFQRRFGTRALTNTPPGEAAKAMLHVDGETFTFPCSVLIRRSALEAIGGFQHAEGLPFVDHPTFLELSLRGPFAFLDRVMGYWRRHEGSHTWTHRAATDRSMPAYVDEFVRDNMAALGLSAAAAGRIVGSWSGWSDLNAGRRHLIDAQWKDARAALRRALRSGTAKVRAGAALGIVASFLHTDLETWLRLARSVDVRMLGATRGRTARDRSH